MRRLPLWQLNHAWTPSGHLSVVRPQNIGRTWTRQAMHDAFWSRPEHDNRRRQPYCRRPQGIISENQNRGNGKSGQKSSSILLRWISYFLSRYNERQRRPPDAKFASRSHFLLQWPSDFRRNRLEIVIRRRRRVGRSLETEL